MNDEVRKGPSEAETQEYEAPAIEKVLSADDLEREVQYAGSVQISG